MSFTATHRYWRSDWSAVRNEQRFGAATAAHAHDYACDVTVRGPIDDETGMIVDLGILDRVLDAEVRARFHGANITVQLPEFADGKLIPTCENLARFIYGRVTASLTGSAQLASVIVREDETISAEFTGDD
ncbi:MAG: 6-carboxytetrahydropterin synthase [Gemmatimonadaceae bacterium]|nr:6-carboxytetrahydropterin synthase [Gemmatimonadaceae bacterium]